MSEYGGTLDLESGKAVRSESGVEEEVAGHGTEGEGAEEIQQEQQQTTEEQAQAAAALEEQAAKVAPTVDYLKSWNEKAGTQFQNDDEIINEVKAGFALKEKIKEYENKLKEYSDFDDPMVKDIARARKAGIGLELYLEAVKMDVDKLDAKQTLKEAFFRKNAGLVATDPEFAAMKFEIDYKARFGKIGETLDVAGLDDFEAQKKTLEFNQEQDYIKRSLNVEATQDKNYLKEWKSKNITIPDVPQQRGMTDEQIQQYFQQADSFVGQNEKVEIPIGDKKFNFGLKDYAETLKKELRDPINTLKKHGIDLESGTIDPGKLGKLLTSAYVAENIGKPLSDWSVDARNIEYLKTKKESPAPSQAIAGGAPGTEDDFWTRFAKGVKAQKEQEAAGA